MAEVVLDTTIKPVAPPATAVAAEPTPESLMAMAFAIYRLAAVLGLQISRNERASTDENKRQYKHWTKVGADSTRSQGPAGFVTAAVAFALQVTSIGFGKQNRTICEKASNLTPNILGFWTQGLSATSQEAGGKASLLQSDLSNPARGADSFRSNVEDASKTLCQNIFQLVASAAKNQ